MHKVIKILVLTSLYPNSIQTRHGVFVEERLRSLLSTGEITARVIAPVPWFPFKHPSFGRYADFASIPTREVRHGIEILHPRYPIIPRIGMTLGPTFMAMTVAPVIKQILAQGYDFDLIDAHYFYPDGVAAVKLARRFNKPIVITARGADVNRIPEFAIPRRQILSAARQAAAIITVSRALKNSLVELGADQEKITSLRNGVDLDRFAPTDRNKARSEINDVGAGRKHIWLAVGHLIERKGMRFAIEALIEASDVALLIAGTGPEEARLRSLAISCGVADRVHFLGHVEHDDLPMYFSAADVLVLPAGSEGMPNVVLEAMACGTAVIATAVGGIPEVVQEPIVGSLMRDRTAAAVMAAWQAVCEYGIDQEQRDARRSYAQHFSWSETTMGQLALFHHILGVGGANDSDVTRQTSADIESAYKDGEC